MDLKYFKTIIVQNYEKEEYGRFKGIETCVFSAYFSA